MTNVSGRKPRKQRVLTNLVKNLRRKLEEYLMKYANRIKYLIVMPNKSTPLLELFQAYSAFDPSSDPFEKKPVVIDPVLNGLAHQIKSYRHQIWYYRKQNQDVGNENSQNRIDNLLELFKTCQSYSSGVACGDFTVQDIIETIDEVLAEVDVDRAIDKLYD
jgi:hypothetical protein